MIKTQRKLLFLEGPLVERIESNSEYVRLYKYDNRYEKTDKSFGRYIINVGNVTSNSPIDFKIVDEFGKNISKEIQVSDEKPVSLPFSLDGDTNYIELQTKTNSENIELYRLEIEFF